MRVEAAAEVIFNLYCNAVLIIAAADDPDDTARDVEAIVLSMLDGLRASPRTDLPVGPAGTTRPRPAPRGDGNRQSLRSRSRRPR